MRRFTKEELEILSVAEQHFVTATKASYKRMTSGKQDSMICGIFEEASGIKLNSHNWGCSKCSFTLYEKCGRKYFEDKAYYDNIEFAELEPASEVIETERVNNKRGRKATNKK